MTHDTIVALAVLGVAGQVIAVLFVLVVAAAGFGVSRPLAWLRAALWGYELWAAFVVSSVATGGSLFFSEIAGFVPCELCWYQRICMYPLSIITLLAAIRGRLQSRSLPAAAADRRRVRLGLPPAGRERRRRSEQRLPRLGAGRLRDQMDQRVRLHDDPDARADRVRPSHRTLSPGGGRVRRGGSYRDSSMPSGKASKRRRHARRSRRRRCGARARRGSARRRRAC